MSDDSWMDDLERQLAEEFARRDENEWEGIIAWDQVAALPRGLALQGKEPSWAWAHYYMLADRDDVSRTRSVLVAMVAHLTLDLPHSLVAIGTKEDTTLSPSHCG